MHQIDPQQSADPTAAGAWSRYYQAPLTLFDIIGNLYGQREFISELTGLPPTAKLLEVGSGSGAMAIFLSWLGYSVTSVDIDPKVIDKARAEAARFNGRVDWTVADAFRLPFPDQSFDLAFHQGLFEHFSNEQIWQMLDEQLRVAKKVIFSVPNQYYPKKDFGNERLMSKKQWDNLLSRYRVVKSTNYSPKRFPKFYLPRVPIQYLAVIEPKLQ